MTWDSCNAIIKDGSKIHVCHLVLRHEGPHKDISGREDYVWEDRGGHYVGSTERER